jgi:hypothetical protein
MDGLNFSKGLTLISGINTIQVNATDLVENRSSLSRTITYDSQAPSLGITVPATDITTNVAEITLQGIVTDALTDVTVTITCDGQTYNPALEGGSFTRKITFTDPKTYAIVVTAEDMAGNKATVQRNVIYQPEQSITIATTPAGLGISVDGISYTAPQTFNWQPGSTHAIATTTPQNGAPGTRHQFTNWSDTGVLSHQITVPASPATYTAGFSTEYQLTTAVSPAGSGAVSPVTGGWYLAGVAVTLVAVPNLDYSFASWTGPVANDAVASTSITLSGPRTVTANLAGKPLLAASLGTKSASGSYRLWPVNLTNTGQTTATGVWIDGLTLTQTYGTSCTPVIKSTFPVTVGDIAAAGGRGTGNITIDFSSCAAIARFTAVVRYSATNGGGGSNTFMNQFR